MTIRRILLKAREYLRRYCVQAAFVMTLLTLILFGSEQLSAAPMSMTAQIFYVDFGGDPYSPITRGNIEDEHVNYGEVNVRAPTFERLMAILSRAPKRQGCFNPLRVRVKIRTPDSILFVDEDGAVEDMSGLRFLSERDKSAVQNLIENALTDFRTAPRPPSRLPTEELETCN